jgi:hypothetical protein
MGEWDSGFHCTFAVTRASGLAVPGKGLDVTSGKT